MANAIPTLRMDISNEDVRKYEASGATIAQAEAKLIQFFRQAEVTDGIRFFSESITDVSSGKTLKNFQCMIAGLFELDDILYLNLTNGDVVAVKFNLV